MAASKPAANKWPIFWNRIYSMQMIRVLGPLLPREAIGYNVHMYIFYNCTSKKFSLLYIKLLF